MSTAEGGGDIVKNSLLFYVDSANPKSYLGSGLVVNNLVFPESGELVNGVSFNTQNKGSFIFDGTDDIINFGDRISSLNLTYPFTIDAWVNVDTTGNTTVNRGIFATSNTLTLTEYYGLAVQLGSFYNGSGNYKVGINVGNGVSAGSTGRRSYISDNEVITGNTWCNIITTLETGPTIRIYINGVEVSGTYSGTGGALVWGSSKITNIGQTPGGYQYILKGNVSIVRFYNKLFSNSEISQNYNATKSRFGL
jgi:hypothetical protein